MWALLDDNWAPPAMSEEYDELRWYFRGAWIVGIPVFLVGWGYAVAHYGFFLGAGLGWIPAAFLGAIAGFLWPLIATLAGAGVVAIAAITLWRITHP